MFFRAQISAVLATVTDFIVMVLFYQVLGLSLPVSVGCGPIAGGLVSFVLNRCWSFQSRGTGLVWQLISYTIVCLVSAAANVVGVLIVMQKFSINYFYARVAVAIGVALLINYPLHRNFVFMSKDILTKE